MGYSADFERSNPDSVETAPSGTSNHHNDHTFEFWWKPESLTAGEDQTFWEARHTDGGTIERLWKSDTAGVHKLRHYMQQITGVAPTAAQHSDIEWDISAYVSIGVLVHIAIAIDISQPTATQEVCYINGVSIGNGTIISGTGISGMAVANNGYRIGADWAGGNGVDGLLKDFRLWGDLRTAGEISANYQHFFASSTSQSPLLLNLWKAGDHHFSSVATTVSGFMTDWSALSSSPPALVLDSPTGWTSDRGDVKARAIPSDGPNDPSIGYEYFVHNMVAREVPANGPNAPTLNYEYNHHVAAATIITTESGAGAGGVKFRMRAFDSTLGRIVYWNAPDTDPLGASYSGPGPLSDIVVSEKNAD